ncbi:MAG: type VI secretion system transmembrane protein TssO [Paludibacteraceae bacterium]|nr:type VI secretion system transmembrane protein TssO [Paludibacteraceae bacterium]
MEQTKNSNIFTAKEKTIGLIYTVLLFLLVAGVSSYVLFFSKGNVDASSGKVLALEQIERIRSFEKFQKDRMERIQALDARVNAIDPGLVASYDKNEVRYILGQFKEEYNKNQYDKRYRIFSLITQFYEYRMFDKERLSAVQANIDWFRSNLDICQQCVDEITNNR